jgi:hypothetical protein
VALIVVHHPLVHLQDPAQVDVDEEGHRERVISAAHFGRKGEREDGVGGEAVA